MSQKYDLHASLGYQTTFFSRIGDQRFEKLLTPLGLTRVNWCVLLAVGQEKLKNPSEIATFVGIDRTATSRALRKLDADGLISRCAGAGDKRMTEVSITKDGKQRLKQATKAAEENAEYFGGKISWYERYMLGVIIQKLMSGETRDVSGL